MSAILDVALPFFAVIFCGYGALRRRIVDEAAIQGLNSFVFYFALPALLFVKVATAPLDDLFDPRFFAVFYGVAVVILGAMLIVGRLAFRLDWGSAMLMAMACVWTNSGYMGIPLLITAFGPAAALPAVLALTFDNLTISPATILMLEARSGGHGLGRSIRIVARNLARNPLIVAVFAGFAWAVLGLALPSPVIAFGNLLGVAAAPCALFALGASLVGTTMSEARAEIALVTLVKLAVHPFLIYVAAFHLLPLGGDLALWTVITAALPTGASVFVLAERYRTYARRTSTIVFVTHLISVVTVTLLLAWAQA